MDQYGVYLPLVYDTVWIHQRRSEQEKKQGIGWEGRITDNILFNYCLNKNIVFLKKRNQLKSNKTREKKEMKSKQLICKSKRGNGNQRKKGKTKPNMTI